LPLLVHAKLNEAVVNLGDHTVKVATLRKRAVEGEKGGRLEGKRIRQELCWKRNR